MRGWRQLIGIGSRTRPGTRRCLRMFVRVFDVPSVDRQRLVRQTTSSHRGGRGHAGYGIRTQGQQQARLSDQDDPGVRRDHCRDSAFHQEYVCRWQ